MTTYEEVAQFPSRTHPGEMHTVKMRDDGVLTCNCKAWVFKPRGVERECRHTQIVKMARVMAAGAVKRAPTAAEVRKAVRMYEF